MSSGYFLLLYLHMCTFAIYTPIYIYKYIPIYLIGIVNSSSLQRYTAMLKSWQTDWLEVNGCRDLSCCIIEPK